MSCFPGRFGSAYPTQNEALKDIRFGQLLDSDTKMRAWIVTISEDRDARYKAPALEEITKEKLRILANNGQIFRVSKTPGLYSFDWPQSDLKEDPYPKSPLMSEAAYTAYCSAYSDILHYPTDPRNPKTSFIVAFFGDNPKSEMKFCVASKN